MLSRHVVQPDIVWQRSEKRNAFPNQHGYASDGQALNQTCPKKFLDRNPTVDVEAMNSSGG